MLKAHTKTVRLLSILTDIVLLLVALAGTWWLQRWLGTASDVLGWVWFAATVVPVWLLLLNHFEVYDSLRRRTRIDLVVAVIMVHSAGGFVQAALLLLIAPQLIINGALPLFLAISCVLLTAEKVLVRSGLGLIRRRGFNTRNLLLVGRPEDIRNVKRRLAGHADWGLVVLGAMLTEADAEQALPDSIQNLGPIQRIVDVCKGRPVDEVILCTYQEMVPDFTDTLSLLQEMGINIRVVLKEFDQRFAKKELGFFCDRIPFLTISSNRLDCQTLLLKRILDSIGALVGLLLTALIFPALALAIKLESPGPVLFSQQRVGENGRLFTVWKFRSMYVDAEQRKQALLDQNEMQGAIFKISDDPRITRVGRFLRRTSLDECPQFWNVLTGDMSLVGTRPPTPDEVAQYQNWHRRRISIRPGITGVWQVSGRSRVQDFDEIVRLDLSYIDNWSLWLDIKILCKTLQVVLFRQGSC